MFGEANVGSHIFDFDKCATNGNQSPFSNIYANGKPFECLLHSMYLYDGYGTYYVNWSHPIA